MKEDNARNFIYQIYGQQQPSTRPWRPVRRLRHQSTYPYPLCTWLSCESRTLHSPARRGHARDCLVQLVFISPSTWMSLLPAGLPVLTVRECRRDTRPSLERQQASSCPRSPGIRRPALARSQLTVTHHRKPDRGQQPVAKSDDLSESVRTQQQGPKTLARSG